MKSSGSGWRHMALALCLLIGCSAFVGASARTAGGEVLAGEGDPAVVSPTICPQSPAPKDVQPTEVCYYLPEVYFSPTSGTVSVNQTFTFTLDVWYAEYGCTKYGAWSGSLATSGGRYGPQSITVGPFGSTGTYTYNLDCGGYGGTSTGSTTVTVVGSGGGDPGSGGGSSCTENTTSQMYATFLSMSGVPASVVAGQAFTASMTFQNTGACTWTAANGYRLGSQNPENNTTWGTNRIYLGAGEAIAPGQSKTFTITAIAPSTAGSYGWGWRMVRDGINWLGTPTNGSFTTISVSAPAPGPTVTLSANPTVIGPGDSSTLSWSSTNATSCSAAWTSSTATSGSQSVSPTAATTYSITCSGAGGYTSKSVTIDVDTSVSDYAIKDQYGAGNPTFVVDGLFFDSATGQTCRWAHGHVTWSNYVGVWLWRYHEDIKWCWRNISHITSVFRNRWGESHSFGGYSPWHFDGNITNSCNTENCSDMATRQPATALIATTGSFTACALKIVLCHTKTPYIAVTIRAGGNASIYWTT
jgi:hypothetical protein